MKTSATQTRPVPFPEERRGRTRGDSRCSTTRDRDPGSGPARSGGGRDVTVPQPPTQGSHARPYLRLLAVGYRWERDHVAIRVHKAGVTVLPVQQVQVSVGQESQRSVTMGAQDRCQLLRRICGRS